MKVAILYDCMFPYTVGGGERWYVNVAERLAAEHEVTYVTLRQWGEDEAPQADFNVIAVGPPMELYTESGRRRFGPPLRYGLGVFWHLLRRGGGYDIVHSSAFPYFSVIGAWVALRFHRRTKLVVDWLEVWSLAYWQSYIGKVGGRIGFAVQQLCARLPDASFAISRLHADRLPGRNVTVHTGLVSELADDWRPTAPAPAPNPPRAVFAGRHIPEKNVLALPAALAAAREQLPELRMTILGDGPEHGRLLEEIERTGTVHAIDAPGFVDAKEVHQALASASCLVLPSVREGYGMVVIEALCQGTPAVVVAGPDNAATDFITEGENGFIAASAEPEEIGAAIAKCVDGGDALRTSAWQWYEEHRKELSIEDSLVRISEVYAKLNDG